MRLKNIGPMARAPATCRARCTSVIRFRLSGSVETAKPSRVVEGAVVNLAKPIGLKQLAGALERAEAGSQDANIIPAMETQRARVAGAGGTL